MIELIATGTVALPCVFPSCTNAARYITVDGRLACGTCPVEHKVDAIKIASVPELLRLVRRFLVEQPPAHTFHSWAQMFREVIGKDVSVDPIPVRDRTCVVKPTYFPEPIEDEVERFKTMLNEQAEKL